MADKIKKFLRKLSKQELEQLLPYLMNIEATKLAGIDVKPLKGHKNIYRARVGNYRIIFQSIDQKNTKLLLVGKRDD